MPPTTTHNFQVIWTDSIHDNVIEQNWTNTPAATNHGVNNLVTGVHLVLDSTWPAAAQTIIDQAGLEREYQHLLAYRLGQH